MGILKNLRAATKGLLYSSESDVPLKPFLWPQADVGATLDTTALLAYLEQDPRTVVEEVETVAFFEPMTTLDKWAIEEDKAVVARFIALVETLTHQLINTRTFRIGEGPEFEVYVIGRTPDGDWSGVMTRLTET